MGFAVSLDRTNPENDPAISSLPPDSPYFTGDMLYEVVDGKIVEKPVWGQQSEIASLISMRLGTFATENRLGRVIPFLLFRIDQRKNLQRRPDVAFVSDARWPFRKRVPTGAAWDVIPDLAVEVVSPTNSAYEMQEKVQRYFAAGVAEMWIIYPNVRLLYRYTSPTQIQVIQSGEELDGGALFPGFRMPLSELFEDDPE